jgi:hypothetical protein
VSPNAIRHNVVKWSIGGHSTTQSGLPRMMTTVYNPSSPRTSINCTATSARLSRFAMCWPVENP